MNIERNLIHFKYSSNY